MFATRLYVDKLFETDSFDPRDIFYNSLYVKSDHWSYEDEWRIVFPGRAPTQSFEDIPLHYEEIDGIIFGLRTSKSDIEEILEIVGSRRISLMQTTRQMDTFDIGITDYDH